MDLPPMHMEMLRLDLRGQPQQQRCVPSGSAPDGRLSTSVSGSITGTPPCRGDRFRIRIDEPAGWPVVPPPPVPTLP